MTGPVSPSPAPAMPPNLVRTPAPARKRRKQPKERRPPTGTGQGRRPPAGLVVTVVALVLVLVVAGGVFVIFKGGGLKTGSAVANVTWKAPVGGVASSTASFTGKVDGLALQGRATGVSPIAGGQAVLHAGHWTGTLGGTAFSLEVAESIGSGPSTGVVNKFLGTFAITFHITGTYGTDKVSATAVPDLHNGGRLSFSGTVGTYHVKGNMSVPHQKGTKERVRATFVLKG